MAALVYLSQRGVKKVDKSDDFKYELQENPTKKILVKPQGKFGT